MAGRLAVALAVLLGFFATASNGQTRADSSPGQGSDVKARLRDKYQLVVPVSVNGLEPLDFVLDTGTKTSLIDERLGRKLGLPVIARMPLTTFTGMVTVLIHRLDSVSVGVASVKGLEVGCVDLRRVHSLDWDVHGVLGQDFLGRFDYLLDYGKRRVVLDGEGTLAGALEGERVPMERRDFRDHVHIGSETEPPRQVHFMLDSGTPFVVFFETAGWSAGLRTEGVYSPGSLVNQLGSRLIEEGRLPALRIGSMTMNNVPVRVTRPRENERRWENGLLPTSLFRSVYISHSESFVVLNGRLGGR